jgi:hypothetical protein
VTLLGDMFIAPGAEDFELPPRHYVAGALRLMQHAAGLVALVDLRRLEELIAGGAGLAGTEEQRAAALAFVGASRAFFEAAATAHERGLI